MNGSTVTVGTRGVDALAQAAGQLFTLPQVAMEVLELTNNPQVDTQALKACLERDPALTARILQVVNSSLFGLSRKVGDLGQALALLGTVPLKLLVLSFSLPDELFRNLGADFLAQYWKSSLCHAVAARCFHQRGWGQSGDEAFVAGLLRQVGQLVLAQMLGPPYLQLWHQCRDQGAELLVQERAYLGLDHVALSQRLLQQWKLPPALVQALAAPEADEPLDPTTCSLRGAVWLGTLSARLLVHGQQEAWETLLAEARRLARLEQADVRRVLQQVQEGVDCVAEALQLEGIDSLDVEAVLAQAQRRLAQVAQDAAVQLAGGGESLLRLSLNTQQHLRESLNRALQGDAQPALREPQEEEPRCANPPETEPPVQASADSSCPTEPLEGASDPRLRELVHRAAWECRARRMPLSVMLVSLSGLQQLQVPEHLPQYRVLQRLVLASCRRLDWWPKQLLPVRDSLVALVLQNCDRSQAVQLGYDLIHLLREVCSRTAGQLAQRLHVHVGIASVEMLPPNFEPGRLLESCQRCLNAAAATGMDHLKSIECY